MQVLPFDGACVVQAVPRRAQPPGEGARSISTGRSRRAGVFLLHSVHKEAIRRYPPLLGGVDVGRRAPAFARTVDLGFCAGRRLSNIREYYACDLAGVDASAPQRRNGETAAGDPPVLHIAVPRAHIDLDSSGRDQRRAPPHAHLLKERGHAVRFVRRPRFDGTNEEKSNGVSSYNLTNLSCVNEKACPSSERLPAPNSDFDQLKDVPRTADELALVKKVRSYMETKVAPIIDKYWADDALPFQPLPLFKALGSAGLWLRRVRLRRRKPEAVRRRPCGAARVDASMPTFFGVHSGLAMGSIDLDGSEEQRSRSGCRRWPAGRRSSRFGLTGAVGRLGKRAADRRLRPSARATPGSSTARSAGIGTTWCDLSIIWARDLYDNQVKGFIVENKTTPGFSVEKSRTRSAPRWSRTGRSCSKTAGCRRPNVSRRSSSGARHASCA